uniref:Octanoyltransferase n=1 Tax=Desulfacinum infernum TaxID=35837 RepID=A0A832A1V5_9BACT
MARSCRLVDLGLVDYGRALAVQHRCVDARHQGLLDRDVFFLVEHFPVFTYGRRSGAEHLCVPQDFLEARGIAVFAVERGGSVTYHGPGQLVVYPVVHLPTAGWKAVDWVTALEEVMIRTARRFGVAACRHPRGRGVWVGEKKLGSLGIAVRHGISFHGVALNVHNALEPFQWIRPCGLSDVAMTSLAVETHGVVSMTDVKRVFLECAEDVLGVHFEPTDPEDLFPKAHGRAHARA